jgi:hypothetical protein
MVCSVSSHLRWLAVVRVSALVYGEEKLESTTQCFLGQSA